MTERMKFSHVRVHHGPHFPTIRNEPVGYLIIWFKNDGSTYLVTNEYVAEWQKGMSIADSIRAKM